MKRIYAVRFTTEVKPEQIRVAFVLAKDESAARRLAYPAIKAQNYKTIIIHGVEPSSMNIFIEPKATIMGFD